MNKQATLSKDQHDHDYGAQIAVVRSDMERLHGDFIKLRDEVAEDATERMKHFSDYASETLKEKGEALKEKGEALREASEQSRDAVVAEVRHHPLASVLAATGAGLAIGALAMWAQTSTKP